MQTAISCSLMRGGTSKGLYFLAEDLPQDIGLRDQVLLAAMGSPDERQIDGLGGAHPLTSKVAIVSKSARPEADVDYLFLQVAVDSTVVSAGQNCGNILAGVGAFAVEKGLVNIQSGVTDVRIYMENTAGLAIASIETPNRQVNYEGQARIDGVPGTAAAVSLSFLNIAGSSCGSLLPTGAVCDVIDGVEVTCIDNGMPVVMLKASDLGKTGNESPKELEADTLLCQRVERIRLEAGLRMNLSDVSNKTVPKVSLLAAARHGGAIATRTFIPHRVHEAIGVLGAVSVATGLVLEGSVAQKVSGLTRVTQKNTLEVEHPTGFFGVEIDVLQQHGKREITRAALLRTTRMLMNGEVMIPVHVWAGK